MQVDPSKVDYLFILTYDGTMYLIPTKEISNQSTITLGEKYKQYIVTTNST